jgi:hypothetical protein
LILNGQTYNATVQAGQGADNVFSLTVPAAEVRRLADGTQALQISVTNRYGATTQLSPSLTVDTQAPGQNASGNDETIAFPTVVLTENVNATPGINAAELTDGMQAQVTLPTGSLVGDKLEIAVTAPNGTVRVFNHTLIQADITSGTATVTLPTSTVAENGVYVVKAKTTDVAGNTSKASAPLSFTLDTLAPGQNADGSAGTIPATVLTLDEAVNGVNQTELANDLQYQIQLPTGSKAGDTLTFSFTGPDNTVRTASHAVTAENVAAGTFILSLPNTLVNQDGTYTVTVRSTDTAGNAGNLATTTFDLTAALSTLRDAAQGNTANVTNTQRLIVKLRPPWRKSMPWSPVKPLAVAPCLQSRVTMPPLFKPPLPQPTPTALRSPRKPNWPTSSKPQSALTKPPLPKSPPTQPPQRMCLPLPITQQQASQASLALWATRPVATWTPSTAP